jgi:hypothetical protein
MESKSTTREIDMAPIVTVCAWCRDSAHLTPYWKSRGYRVSHGLCPECKPGFRASMGLPTRRAVVALHKPTPDHLVHVHAIMAHVHAIMALRQERGEHDPRPRILGYEQDGAWQAIVGSHRIAAAAALGVPVVLVYMDPDEPITAGALLYAAGELLPDLPLGLTPREIVAERERLGSGVRYQVEVAR